MDRREEYGTNPEHASLKNQREKRDQLKEKKFQAQQKKSTSQAKGDE
jgi:lysine 2,3-aminomutase